MDLKPDRISQEIRQNIDILQIQVSHVSYVAFLFLFKKNDFRIKK